MRNGKHALRALGLSFLAAMGLMAFMAAGAQATAWDVNGTLLGDSLLPEVGGNLRTGVEALLLTTTGAGQPLVIHCKKFTITAGNLHKTDATGTLQYDNSTCLTLINGVNQKNCGHETGGINILPIKALILPVLHSGEVYLLVEPQSGETITQIHYGALCSLPLTSLKGTEAYECEDGNLKLSSCEVSRVTQFIKPIANQGLLGDALKYGNNPASLDGEAEIFLKGAHAGLPFNAL
jgi:hypothetical protein